MSGDCGERIQRYFHNLKRPKNIQETDRRFKMPARSLSVVTRFRFLAMMLAFVATVFCLQPHCIGQEPEPPGGDAPTGGIQINAEGVLSTRAVVGNLDVLNRQRLAAATASLNKDLQQPSDMRKVSLTRLEAEVKKLVDAGQPIPADMKYLAGMNRITHVFYYPETKDIVLAGPAEGFFLSADNRVIGTKTGAATLNLQDLIVALRAFSPDGKKTSMISVSIDPTREGILRMAEAYAHVQGRFRPGDERAVVDLFREANGLQVITIQGVSPKTNFARVLVEADYHMKLIGIGLEKPPVKIISFIEKADPAAVARNSLQRWYFQPNYDCVSLNEDKTAMQLVGSGVKLVGEDEQVDAQGNRKGTGGMNAASKAFCGSFTKLYDQLAQRSPLWGELRNLVDLSITAAYIQKYDLYGKAGWKMETFGDEGKVPVEIMNTPTHVPSVVNAVWKGRLFMAPTAGGVNLQPRYALNSDVAKTDTEGKIDAVKAENEAKLAGLADGQWWWD